jgi:hypothetical protein
MLNKRWIGVLAIVLIALPSGTMLAGDEKGMSSLPSNVLVTVSVGETGPGKEKSEKSYKLLSLDGQVSELLTGWRYPIPTSSFNTAAKAGGKPVPVTSFSYQNVGMTVNVETKIVAEGRVRLRGHIEVSGVDSDAPKSDASIPAAPKLGTFSHRFDTILADGVSATISSVPHPGGGSIVVKLQVDVEA